jgi:hypothetical protein
MGRGFGFRMFVADRGTDFGDIQPIFHLSNKIWAYLERNFSIIYSVKLEAKKPF